ncbi:MAG: hypothetical protein QM719_01330 [Thermomonas sp.]
MDASEEKDWKLKLRYGRISTPYKHFTIVADGVSREMAEGFECRPGPAVMAMKGWATDVDEAVDMIRFVGEKIGFSVSGKVEVYDTEPEDPPREKPFGYDISFVPYDAGDDSDA